jgi:hypothetical protein
MFALHGISSFLCGFAVIVSLAFRGADWSMLANLRGIASKSLGDVLEINELSECSLIWGEEGGKCSVLFWELMSLLRMGVGRADNTHEQIGPGIRMSDRTVMLRAAKPLSAQRERPFAALRVTVSGPEEFVKSDNRRWACYIGPDGCPGYFVKFHYV